MKLSTAAALGIQGVLVLAERHGSGTVTLEEICRARALPRDYMARIFSLLSRAGLVAAVRGKHGGYRLGRDPGAISLLEVIEAVEGPLAMNLCQHSPPRCEEVGCPVRPVWSDIQRRVSSVLAGKTIRDLACGSSQTLAGTLAPAAGKHNES
ncbi:MAG TPA: Rrf2 family transcriptional regulator [Phycisphaerae bacterium]|nr:Rrf2 family transcriptional regulator [Phycisphaerae bacterium]